MKAASKAATNGSKTWIKSDVKRHYSILKFPDFQLKMIYFRLPRVTPSILWEIFDWVRESNVLEKQPENFPKNWNYYIRYVILNNIKFQKHKFQSWIINLSKTSLTNDKFHIFNKGVVNAISVKKSTKSLEQRSLNSSHVNH